MIISNENPSAQQSDCNISSNTVKTMSQSLKGESYIYIVRFGLALCRVKTTAETDELTKNKLKFWPRELNLSIYPKNLLEKHFDIMKTNSLSLTLEYDNNDQNSISTNDINIGSIIGYLKLNNCMIALLDQPKHQQLSFLIIEDETIVDNVLSLLEQYSLNQQPSTSSTEFAPQETIQIDTISDRLIKSDINETLKKMNSFDDIELCDTLRKNLEFVGQSGPTLIQKYLIPIIIDGNDLLVSSLNAPGRRTAYLIPIINRIIKTIERNDIKTLDSKAYPICLIVVANH